MRATTRMTRLHLALIAGVLSASASLLPVGPDWQNLISVALCAVALALIIAWWFTNRDKSKGG